MSPAEPGGTELNGLSRSSPALVACAWLCFRFLAPLVPIVAPALPGIGPPPVRASTSIRSRASSSRSLCAAIPGRPDSIPASRRSRSSRASAKARSVCSSRLSSTARASSSASSASVRVLRSARCFLRVISRSIYEGTTVHMS